MAGTKKICTIYDNRPEVCKQFPSNANMIKDFPSCSYYFDGDGNRHGECNGCGECCMRPYLYLPEFNKKFCEKPCPYLIEK